VETLQVPIHYVKNHMKAYITIFDGPQSLV
jgi:hypothetical protein